MGLKKLNLKKEYRSFTDDIINDFYVPVLSNSKVYKRAVGYFSSTALIEISKGIEGLIRNNGKIQIIASPNLTEEDIEAIKEGYKTRKEVVEKSILKSLDFSTEDYYEKKRLNLLSHLIATGVLNIKIAFIESTQGIGIYHEKMGLLEDEYGEKVVFSGSLNETRSALSYNYESFDVFTSWKGEIDRIQSKEDVFNQLWDNKVNMVETYDFPDIAIEKFNNYIFEEPDLVMDERALYQTFEKPKEKVVHEKGTPRIPNGVTLHDYQKEAIQNWKESCYRGIFDMATGTGKTYTGLGAITELFQSNNERLAVVIVCPYQHLVEQWVEDIEAFGMQPIIGYSASRQKRWKENLTNTVIAFNYEISNFFVFITTNATFGSDFVQQQLNKISEDLILLIDEAHNFGAPHLSQRLLQKATFRLALSATIERHNDEEGTEVLYKYFGNKCIEYTLESAIENNMLTPYNYYPIIVTLSEEELEEYKELTTRIGRLISGKKKDKFPDAAKHLLIRRARLVAATQEKISALQQEIQPYVKDNHILVYCGATTLQDPGYKEGYATDDEKRQIDIVTSLLGNKLNMKVSKFTSEENMAEREVLKKDFEEANNLQVLIAIRCLDEGVNIPSIKTAFILASSTNPKEYIQRRGRVLRKFKGKDRAYIYDFITLPISIEEAMLLDDNDLSLVRGLAIREITRMRDFAFLAENSSIADGLIYDIEDAFKLYEINKKEEEDGYI